MKFTYFFSALLSSLLFVLGFPPWDFWPLIWICLVPWFYSLYQAKTLREAFRQGLLVCYCVSVFGFYWVAFVLREFGGLSWPLSILGFQIYCLFGEPQFILFGLLFFVLKKKSQFSLKSFFILAFLYTAFDAFLPKLFQDTLGHSLYKAKNLRQLADLGGAHALTFLIVLSNLCLCGIWIYFINSLNQRKNQSYRNLCTPVFVFIFLVSVTWTYGKIRNHQIEARMTQPEKRVQIAAIQANIGDFEKIAAKQGVFKAAESILNTFIELSNQALGMHPKPEVVVWPETSYPSMFGKPNAWFEYLLDQTLLDYSRSIGVPLLFGGYDRIGKNDYNAFFFLSPDEKQQVYHKSILLMFGEYIPGIDSIPLLKKYFPQIGNFGRGIGPQVFKIKNISIAPIICYEALFPSYTLQSAREKSELILNITNDSWFGPFSEPQLHLALTVFRSIETRLPLLRSTNTGISTLILPNGEITYPTDIGKPAILNVNIPILPSTPTLMKTMGDWFGWFSLSLGVFGLFL